ncbi:ATP-grasp domain-containing protein [Granulibacter bethesdensis]|uniref:ATP-grasp domain-containing protein n=1 Tax=Granulibacter bethesdensis TaxID=364410 RepID=UPI0009096F4B|nr:ATP-grasp domain-containing protein [Granulibacter bethesdensis]APH59099.1 Ribosomal protein S6 modification protein [Granulibacter bethesdensis]
MSRPVNGSSPLIVVFIDDQDWHLRMLRAAFSAAGATLLPVRLSDCGLDTTQPYGLLIPGLDGRLPDGVLVRAVAGGSFESVTIRLGVLHALHAMGVPVWNSVGAIERCVDKSMTSFLLQHSGLPTPPSWTVPGRDAALAIAHRELVQERLVLKPLFGSQGKGLTMIARAEDLPPPEEVNDVYYLQRFIPAHGRGYEDYRLFVCDGEVIAAMIRRADDWITNIRQGAIPSALTPDADMCDLAVRAAQAVGAAYAGVDLIRNPEGQFMVLEVNSMPGWRGLQQVVSYPIAEQLASRMLASLRR